MRGRRERGGQGGSELLLAVESYDDSCRRVLMAEREDEWKEQRVDMLHKRDTQWIIWEVYSSVRIVCLMTQGLQSDLLPRSWDEYVISPPPTSNL